MRALVLRLFVLLSAAGLPFAGSGFAQAQSTTPGALALRIKAPVELNYGVLPGGSYAKMTVGLSPQSFRDRPSWTLLGKSGTADIVVVPDRPSETVLSFAVPALPNNWPPWQSSHLTMTGLVQYATEEPVRALIYDSDIRVSERRLPLILTLITVAIIYRGCALIAWAGRRRGDRKRARAAGVAVPPGPTLLETLDPVQLTASATGRASLSKLQVFAFSLLVFAIVLYLQVRLGFLTGLSNDVLALLGISAGGALAGKVTAVLKDRLQYVNWAWLRQRGWLPPEGEVKPRARWRELFTDEREFDVYRLQMAIFSIVVAIALVTAGHDRISSFEIPDQLLILLGLSQFVYVGGKAVTPSSRGELDEQLTEVRRLDRAFQDKAVEALGPPPAGQPPWTAAQIEAAAQADHKAYRDALRLAAEMFSATFGQPVKDPLV